LLLLGLVLMILFASHHFEVKQKRFVIHTFLNMYWCGYAIFSGSVFLGCAYFIFSLQLRVGNLFFMTSEILK